MVYVLLALDLQFGARAIAAGDGPTILRAGEEGVGQGHAELLA
jgi:hypothetical protein